MRQPQRGETRIAALVERLYITSFTIEDSCKPVGRCSAGGVGQGIETASSFDAGRRYRHIASRNPSGGDGYSYLPDRPRKTHGKPRPNDDGIGQPVSELAYQWRQGRAKTLRSAGGLCYSAAPWGVMSKRRDGYRGENS